MDKLDQVRGVLRGIKNIAMQGIYADTFKGMETQCVATYRKCIATLKTVSGFEDIEGLAPDLTDEASMQEIGFAVEMVLNLVSEGSGPMMGRGMRGWMQESIAGERPMPPVPPVPPVPPIQGMRGRHAWRSAKRQLREHFRRGFNGAQDAEHHRRLQELQDEMQERVEEEQERFEESVENMEEKMEELQERIEEMRERLQERLEEIREKYEEKVEELHEAAEEAEEEATEADEDDENEDDNDPRI